MDSGRKNVLFSLGISKTVHTFLFYLSNSVIQIKAQFFIKI